MCIGYPFNREYYRLWLVLNNIYGTNLLNFLHKTKWRVVSSPYNCQAIKQKFTEVTKFNIIPELHFHLFLRSEKLLRK